jgi:hypothetical protein
MIKKLTREREGKSFEELSDLLWREGQAVTGALVGEVLGSRGAKELAAPARAIALKSVSKNEVSERRVIPASLESFVVNPAFGAGVLASQIEGDMAKHGEIFRRMAQPDSGLIFAKGPIENPVDTVLNPPMRADRVGKLLDIMRKAREIIALLDGHLVLEVAFRFDHPQTAELGPGVLLHEGRRGL